MEVAEYRRAFMKNIRPWRLRCDLLLPASQSARVITAVGELPSSVQRQLVSSLKLCAVMPLLGTYLAYETTKLRPDEHFIAKGASSCPAWRARNRRAMNG